MFAPAAPTAEENLLFKIGIARDLSARFAEFSLVHENKGETDAAIKAWNTSCMYEKEANALRDEYRRLCGKPARDIDY